MGTLRCGFIRTLLLSTGMIRSILRKSRSGGGRIGSVRLLMTLRAEGLWCALVVGIGTGFFGVFVGGVGEE